MKISKSAALILYNLFQKLSESCPKELKWVVYKNLKQLLPIALDATKELSSTSNKEEVQDKLNKEIIEVELERIDEAVITKELVENDQLDFSIFIKIVFFIS